MNPPARLPFSWKALALAPWPVPLGCSAVLAIGLGGRDPFAAFLLCSAAGLVVGFGGTVALVACLWLVARVRPVTRGISALAGTALGIMGYLPFLSVDYGASGDNSGPPTESILDYLLRTWNNPFLWTFVAGGLVTALLYDALARRFSRPAGPSQPG